MGASISTRLKLFGGLGQLKLKPAVPVVWKEMVVIMVREF